jgi:glutathione S-transferase
VLRALVHRRLFIEQNLLEPNLGTARFWHLTGREAQQAEGFAQRLQAGKDALGVLDRGLAGRQFLVADTYSVADIALYAYTHVAGQAGIDLAAFPAIAPWLARVEATDGFENDLEAYPPNAHVVA